MRFKKDSELVSIREIPARENKSDSSDNDILLDDSSTDEESETSVSDTSSDEDSDEEDARSMVDKISRLVLRHTRGDKRGRPVNNNGARTIPPRPPRLRRPRPAPHRALQKFTLAKSQGKAINTQLANDATKSKTVTGSANSYGRLTQLRRAQSCSSDQREKLKRRPPSPSNQIRSSSAKAALSLNTRPSNSIAADTSLSLATCLTNDRYTLGEKSYTNSGQERTKLYAWQVANGAPLVTTPGISPLYAEQVTVTKLKN